MKTTAPTMGGTQLPHVKYVEVDDRNAKETYQIIENRMNDAMPRISSPIQKTEVFSPLNIFYQMSVCRQKLLNITTVFGFTGSPGCANSNGKTLNEMCEVVEIQQPM